MCMKRLIPLQKIFISLLLAVVLLHPSWSVWSAGSRYAWGADSAFPIEVHALSFVEAAKKRLSLLDLLAPETVPEDWKPLLKEKDIGQSPGLEDQMFVRSENLKTYLRLFLQSKGIDDSQVRVMDIFKEYVLGHAPRNPEDVAIEKVYASGTVVLPSGDTTHEVVASSNETFLGNVTLTLRFFVDGEKIRDVKVNGKVESYQNILHAHQALERNKVLTSSDIEIRRTKVASTSIPYATNPEEVIGKNLLKNLEAGEPIQTNFLDKSLVLKRGDLITVVYQEAGLMLTAKGKAKDAGGIGDLIEVDNLSSNRTVTAQVLDSQMVKLIP